MKKKWILVVVAMALILAFFPYRTSYVISNASVFINEQNEVPEEGALSIAVSETRSLLVCYKMQFSYTYNGGKSKTPVTTSYAKTDDGYCLISQMYYDEEEDHIGLCSLYYKEDLSYAVIRWDHQEILYKG